MSGVVTAEPSARTSRSASTRGGVAAESASVTGAISTGSVGVLVEETFLLELAFLDHGFFPGHLAD